VAADELQGDHARPRARLLGASCRTASRAAAMPSARRSSECPGEEARLSARLSSSQASSSAVPPASIAAVRSLSMPSVPSVFRGKFTIYILYTEHYQEQNMNICSPRHRGAEARRPGQGTRGPDRENRAGGLSWPEASLSLNVWETDQARAN
jgi:hypothetical protein